jgi:threonyl-tRNA synthetase
MNKLNKKDNSKDQKLEAMRHSCEHILHQAMVELYPGLKRAMGPATDEGFYFDFDYEGKISEEDFPKIEARMQEIIDKDLPFIRQEVSIKKGRKMFAGNPYKQDWLDQIEEKSEKAAVYWTGEPDKPGSDVDLCKGPHVKSTGEVGAFKLLSVAGAYWHGDEKNKMLTRIYGTCFPTKSQLKDYLWRLEEAKKRDHRVLGQKLELFMFSEEVGQGLPLYLPNGAMIRHLLMDFALNTYFKHGYKPVSSPHIGSEQLWQHSGHLKFYADSMYGPLKVEDKKYRLKPMNCPFHVKMYNFKKRSYKDLPIRLTEMGTVYRFEKSGELHGLTRPRGFTQDDAHIICTPQQLEKEVEEALKLTAFMYKALKMENLIYKLSTRDPENLDKYFGQEKDWEKAEKALKKVLIKLGHKNYEVDKGGAVYYAPKIDIDGVDSLGRRWQLSTIQIDFNLPFKFNMKYVDANGKEKTPFMIHRALLGSLERFLGVYIEHTAGSFPVWLSPLQVKIIPISENQVDYAVSLEEKLKAENIRIEVDSRSETMQKKIREAEEQKVPYMLVVGTREVEANTVSVRQRGEKSLGVMKIDKFLAKIKKDIELKA